MMDMRDILLFTARAAGATAPDPARVRLWRQAQGILVVRLDNLVDVLMTALAIRAIRQANPLPCRNCLQSVCPEGHHTCLVGVRPTCVAEAARELLRCADVLRADPELQRRAAAPTALPRPPLSQRLALA
jgi:hypothetical protein